MLYLGKVYSSLQLLHKTVGTFNYSVEGTYSFVTVVHQTVVPSIRVSASKPHKQKILPVLSFLPFTSSLDCVGGKSHELIGPNEISSSENF